MHQQRDAVFIRLSAPSLRRTFAGKNRHSLFFSHFPIIGFSYSPVSSPPFFYYYLQYLSIRNELSTEDCFRFHTNKTRTGQSTFVIGFSWSRCERTRNERKPLSFLKTPFFRFLTSLIESIFQMHSAEKKRELSVRRGNCSLNRERQIRTLGIYIYYS